MLGQYFEYGGGPSGLLRWLGDAIHFPYDDKGAIEYYLCAAKLGHVGAQYAVGRFYESGKGDLSKDLKQAVKFYQYAAERGNADAQSALNRIHQQQEVAELLQNAPNQENGVAQPADASTTATATTTVAAMAHPLGTCAGSKPASRPRP